MLVFEARCDPLSVASKAAKPWAHHVSAVSLSIISSLATKLPRQRFEIEDATMFSTQLCRLFSKRDIDDIC